MRARPGLRSGRRLPPSCLKRQIQIRIQLQLRPTQSRWRQLMAHNVETSSAIARQLFLRTFSAGVPLGGAAAQLSRVMRDEVFPEGANLYRRGEASDRIFFLV